MEELTSWNSYYFAGKAYLKINSLVKTPLHEFMAVERSGLWAPGFCYKGVWKSRKPESGIGRGMGTGSGTGTGNGNGTGAVM